MSRPVPLRALRGAATSSRVHAADCRCRRVCNPRPLAQPSRARPRVSAATLLLIGLVAGFAIVAIADAAAAGPGVAAMFSYEGKAR